LDSVTDSVLRGVVLEGGEVPPVDDEVRDKLFEMLVEIFIIVLDVF
jgi:hypothetical protein